MTDKSQSETLVLPRYINWLPSAIPRGWSADWPHQAVIGGHLDRVTTGECRNLIIMMPPRHTKTETVTIRYPVYRFQFQPQTRIAVGCHTMGLSEKFGRKARKVAKGRVALSSERSAGKEWETAEGGVYRACGVSAAPTGEGFHGLLIDDPIRSRKEASSETVRDSVWDWWIDDMETRCEPGAWKILTATPWDYDDLIHRLILRQGHVATGGLWEVLRAPAIAETQDERDEWAEKIGLPLGELDPIGREPGEALCPQRYTVDDLRQLEKGGLYRWLSLYQLRPSKKGGDVFIVSRIMILGAMPSKGQFVRYWDMAATEGDGCYTSGSLMCKTPDHMYGWCDVVRFQHEPGERNKRIIQQAKLDGRDIPIVIEQEPGSGGIAQIRELQKALAGWNVKGHPVTENKEARADPLAVQVNIANTFMVRGHWNAEVLHNLEMWPMGKIKDDVDSASGGFAILCDEEENKAY